MAKIIKEQLWDYERVEFVEGSSAFDHPMRREIFVWAMDILLNWYNINATKGHFCSEDVVVFEEMFKKPNLEALWKVAALTKEREEEIPEQIPFAVNPLAYITPFQGAVALLFFVSIEDTKDIPHESGVKILAQTAKDFIPKRWEMLTGLLHSVDYDFSKAYELSQVV